MCVCVFARVNEFDEENKNNDDSFSLSPFSSVRFTSARVCFAREREREIERNRECVCVFRTNKLS